MDIPIHKLIADRLLLIANTSSSKAKAEILAIPFEEQPQLFFIKFLDYVLNEVVYTYNLKKIPEYKINSNNSTTIFELFELLVEMNSSTGGEEIKKKVEEFVQTSDEYMYGLFEMCIDRSLNCGIDIKTIVKTFPELDHLIVPYMRCEKTEMLDKRIRYPAIAQIKADGLFINIFVKNWNDKYPPQFITRYGNEAIIEGITIDNISILSHQVPSFAYHVIHGELLVKDENGDILPREVGNGLINSYIKRFKTIQNAQKKIKEAKTEKAKLKLESDLEKKILDWKDLENRILIKFWDMITEEEFRNKKSEVPYHKRVEKLNMYLWLALQAEPTLKDYILPIESRIVNNRQEIEEYFTEVLERGEEGLVVKNLDLLWQHDVNRGGIIKMKEFKDCDLICVGYVPGEDNYTGGIGALICESSDGFLKVDPSSGLSMQQRGLERVDLEDSSKGWKPIEGFDLNQYTGKIIALKYNTIQKAENSETYSLFIPKIMEIRESFDKVEADSLQKILEG